MYCVIKTILIKCLRESVYCLVSKSTTGLNGPCLAWNYGYISSSGMWNNSQDYNICYNTYSSSDMTYNSSWGAGYYEGSFTQGDYYAWLYHKNSGNPSDSPYNFVAMDTNYWPIGVGALTYENSIGCRSHFSTKSRSSSRHFLRFSLIRRSRPGFCCEAD